METVLFFKFPAAPAQEYTDLEKYFSQSENNTELTETYRSCLAKGELLVCKINHDQVSPEQKLGLTKVRPYLFLMLINLIAPTLTVPNRTVIPWICHRFRSSQRWWHFSLLSRLGKMEQFCSIFAVWVQIWPSYNLCKWKKIIEKSFWTGHFNLPLVS